MYFCTNKMIPKALFAKSISHHGCAVCSSKRTKELTDLYREQNKKAANMQRRAKEKLEK